MVGRGGGRMSDKRRRKFRFSDGVKMYPCARCGEYFPKGEMKRDTLMLDNVGSYCKTCYSVIKNFPGRVKNRERKFNKDFQGSFVNVRKAGVCKLWCR
jgi:hypothetical protein